MEGLKQPFQTFLLKICPHNMNKNWKPYKKLHRWPGLILSFFLLYFGITGIFLNHREAFSHIDIKRKDLPGSYRYNNWNNASVKGSIRLPDDSLLVYGAIGIWKCDGEFGSFRPFNAGIPMGSDNRRVFDLHQNHLGHIYAATQFGLFAWDYHSGFWQSMPTLEGSTRFVGIESIGDTVYILSRSFLYKGITAGPATQLERIELKAPDDYRNTVSLMKTLWQTHSGEILGLPGQLFADLLGLVTIFLSLTGIIWFFFPDWIKRRKLAGKPRRKLIGVASWSLRWHNKIGELTFVFLAIMYLTGIFLRPPFLIAIANVEVPPVKYSNLDQPNPWYDKLRDLLYDNDKDQMLVSTLDGMFTLNRDDFSLEPFENQPPVSVMGITVFEPFENGAYLIGSFSGLFTWHPSNPVIINYVTGEEHYEKGGRPTGDFKVAGLITDPSGLRYMMDYDKGATPLWHDNDFPPMPEILTDNEGLSLWNVALEIHTGRFFSAILGDFYILIVPLAGLAGVVVVISGYILYRRKFKRKGVISTDVE